MRIVARPSRRIRDANSVQELDGAGVRLRFPVPVNRQGFCDLIADAHHRVQRRHRLLEDQRDSRPLI